MTDVYEEGTWLDWRGRRNGYGDGSRWLIQKHANGQGWLLHEPLTNVPCMVHLLPAFQAAVAAFEAFSRRDAQVES